ncbi:MAG TPA: GAP family protein [Solirubrobacteraceae bacterium]
MFGLALLVASIGLADSVNPSTVVPALWLAGTSATRVLAGFTLGVFTVYLVGGIVLVFGPGPVLIHGLHHLQGTVEHLIEAAFGIGAIVFAVILLRSRQDEEHRRRLRRSISPMSAFTLGAGIMVLELPTAFIYFGAITAILAARPGAAAEISLLLAYNVLFVAPLIALLVVRRLAGDRADQWIAVAETRLHRVGQIVLTGVAGLGGVALLTLGIAGLAA